MRKYLLPQGGNFYKANLHLHTNITDGKLTPQEIKALYKSHGYSVVAYTDHDVFIPHHQLTDEGFLALSGFEVAFNEYNLYPGRPHIKACHLCLIAKSPQMELQPCWNPKYAYVGNAKDYRDKIKYDPASYLYERDFSPESINELIRIAVEAGFFVTYNHPCWSLDNCAGYTKYNGMHAMEIYNHSCEVAGYPAYTPGVYEDMLRSGKKIFAVAADDNHNNHPVGSPDCDALGGFVMIKAQRLDYETITDALFKGAFYASNGPEIYDLYVEDNQIHVTCSDAVKITLNKDRRAPLSLNAKWGETVTCASFPFTEDDKYIRITVKDSYGRYANTNAYFIEDLK